MNLLSILTFRCSAGDFNGTVIVEWINVTAGVDILAVPAPFAPLKGFAYVGVSAQRVGLHGYSISKGLLQWDPERYGSLSIPDDGISYDIFSHVAKVLKQPEHREGPYPLGPLTPRKLIATGGSQSGTRLMGYVNGVQPRDHLYDALMPLICFGRAGDFDREPARSDPSTGQMAFSRAVVARVRSDLIEPVFVINSETEATHYFPLRQPDSANFHYWEIAGSSHSPSPQAAIVKKVMVRDGLPTRHRDPATNPSSDVQWLPTVHAAIWHTHEWITSGKVPPHIPPMTVDPEQKVLYPFPNALEIC